MGLTTNPVGLLHRPRFMCREQTFPGTLKSAKISFKWTSYCVTWSNNHVHLYVAGVRVTDSGKLLPANWWPIRTKRGYCTACACVCMSQNNFFPDRSWAYSEGQANHDWITPSYESPQANRLQPITNLWSVLNMAWVGVGCRVDVDVEA